MSFFKKLASMFSPLSPPAEAAYFVYVHSHRCQDYLMARISLANDLSEKDEGGYIARKILVGDGRNRCFERVEVVLHFDGRKNLAEQEISGGRFISEAEYQAGLAESSA